MTNLLKYWYEMPSVIYVLCKHLTDAQPVVKKLVTATGAENYNVLQNNGRIAHQEVDHVSSATLMSKTS
jgi:hypothetical protein